jgi:hypothetical protein
MDEGKKDRGFHGFWELLIANCLNGNCHTNPAYRYFVVTSMRLLSGSKVSNS